MRDLLSMDSGREWSVLTDYVQLLARARPHALRHRARADRGARHGLGIQQLGRCRRSSACSRRRRGDDVATFARQRLFAPLGMTHTTMAADKAGNAQMFEGVQSTCRDMARFGLLMLDRGHWGDRQIVSPGWVAGRDRAAPRPG